MNNDKRNAKMLVKQEENVEFFTPFVMVEHIMDEVPDYRLTPNSSDADISMRRMSVERIFDDRISYLVYNAITQYVDNAFAICDKKGCQYDRTEFLTRLNERTFEVNFMKTLKHYGTSINEAAYMLHKRRDNRYDDNLVITKSNYKDYILMTVSSIYTKTYIELSNALGYPILVNDNESKYLLNCTAKLRDMLDIIVWEALTRSVNKYTEAYIVQPYPGNEEF